MRYRLCLLCFLLFEIRMFWLRLKAALGKWPPKAASIPCQRGRSGSIRRFFDDADSGRFLRDLARPCHGRGR